jgi:nitroimidazol reductase NimA-like FMN-containing flavoprotein (pyridoxamine 5'-phosphate oxidase superfamily)
MRRSDKEITDRAVLEEILREQEVGRLATAVADIPYVVPVNFVYSSGHIVFHGARDGLKMRNIAANPTVCFEVDIHEKKEAESPCDYTYKYMSVIARGKATPIEDPARRLALFRRLVDKYAPGKGKMITEETMSKNPHIAIIDIEVEDMTGKRSPAPPKKA